jgi:hypothetical protein
VGQYGRRLHHHRVVRSKRSVIIYAKRSLDSLSQMCFFPICEDDRAGPKLMPPDRNVRGSKSLPLIRPFIASKQCLNYDTTLGGGARLCVLSSVFLTRAGITDDDPAVQLVVVEMGGRRRRRRRSLSSGDA